MKFKSALIFTALLSIPFQSLFAQGSPKQFWIFLTHSQNLSEKFDVLLDAQTRSEENLNQINSVLLRGALAYKFNPNSSVALGYAYKGDFIENNRTAYESRVYEQYQFDFKVRKIEIQLRGRFEQRFLTDSTSKFALRVRGFIAAQIPVFTNDDFTKGIFVGIQNEIFFNVLKKHYVNNHFFDQNRPFLSLGYRLSKKLETTLDYGRMSDQGYESRESISVFRLSVNTNF